MPIKYVLPAFSGDHKYANEVKVLTSILIELEKTIDWQLQAEEIVGN
jgi:hypothetical protein